MGSSIRNLFVIFMALAGFVWMAPGPALGIQITMDVVENAGQFPGQGAYLKFVYSSGEYVVTTSEAPGQWYSRDPVDQFASDNAIPEGWELYSGGNIWSPDGIVGESLTSLPAGIYRISVLAGAFMYDSFDWSDYAGQWRWELHIQALLPIIDGEVKGYFDFMLGSTDPYATPALALQASLGQYIDIPLAEGGGLIFWIYDHPNSIDNLGSLTFNVTPIPEPATLILLATGTGAIIGYRRRRIQSR